MHPENKFSRMKLTEVKNDECVFIAQIEGSGSFRARLGEMGFVKGQQIKRLFASPVGNPIVFEIMGSKVALRSQEAASIDVVYHAEEIPDSESISSSIKASESSFQIKNKTAHCHCESKKKVQATFEFNISDDTAHGNSTVISGAFVTSARGIEQRCFSAIRITDQS